MNAELDALLVVTDEETNDNTAERLYVLKKALLSYAVFDTEKDVPDNIVDAFVEKVVVSKDGFDWYLRYSPEKAITCSVEGRKNNAVVSYTQNSPFTSPLHRLLSRAKI